MSFMIFGYGSLNVPEDDITGIKTEDEAYKLLHKRILEWCDENDVNIEDTDYTKGDDSFCYGEEEEGVCIFTIIQVPKIRNNVDELLWEAKLEMMQAGYAADDYKYTLCECFVDEHAGRAQELIDEAMNLMDAWQYEED